jgi:hypothetical protein
VGAASAGARAAIALATPFSMDSTSRGGIGSGTGGSSAGGSSMASAKMGAVAAGGAAAAYALSLSTPMPMPMLSDIGLGPSCSRRRLSVASASNDSCVMGPRLGPDVGNHACEQAYLATLAAGGSDEDTKFVGTMVALVINRLEDRQGHGGQ